MIKCTPTGIRSIITVLVKVSGLRKLAKKKNPKTPGKYGSGNLEISDNLTSTEFTYLYKCQTVDFDNLQVPHPPSPP